MQLCNKERRRSGRQTAVCPGDAERAERSVAAEAAGGRKQWQVPEPRHSAPETPAGGGLKCPWHSAHAQKEAWKESPGTGDAKDRV